MLSRPRLRKGYRWEPSILGALVWLAACALLALPLALGGLARKLRGR